MPGPLRCPRWWCGARRPRSAICWKATSRQRTPDQQTEQALCLSIVVNEIIAWNTVYTGRVLDELRAGGELITTSEIERISPLAHQHIHLYGHCPFDLATRPDGHRPLRPPATPPAPAPKTLNRV